jgi:hypothetical protein
MGQRKLLFRLVKGQIKMLTKFYSVSLKGSDHLGVLDVDRRITLIFILVKYGVMVRS